MTCLPISGCALNLEDGIKKAIDSLRSLAVEHNYEMNNYCYITMYVRSIAEYATINRIYGQAFCFQNPPTRVCVECPLPEDCHIVLEAIAFKAPMRRRATISIQENETTDDHCMSNCTNDVTYKRNTMHVQSISHWAPANIGPYSQSTKVCSFAVGRSIIRFDSIHVFFSLSSFRRSMKSHTFLVKLL